VVHTGLDENHGTRLHRTILLADPDAALATHDVVDLVLGVRLLRISRAGG